MSCLHSPPSLGCDLARRIQSIWLYPFSRGSFCLALLGGGAICTTLCSEREDSTGLPDVPVCQGAHLHWLRLAAGRSISDGGSLGQRVLHNSG